MLVALLRFGPNANCIPVCSWQESLCRPKEVDFLVFMQPFLKGAEDFPAKALQFDRQKNINTQVTERGLKTRSPLQCF